ncbi:MAG: hypothetical protein M3Q32_12685 [Pseudomonadota bacterium]|nr:hypothetical protein [Burkholderiales bacterium]MDQ3197181.1 hypothetical protein [Pseudomonadota bacterium]
MRNSMTVLILSLGLFTGSAFSESGFSDDAMDLAIPVDVLATQTGRENLQDDVILAAELGDNVLVSGSTGSNVISGNAFSHAGGISTVIQNSGNQVIIQSSMIVNLTTR